MSRKWIAVAAGMALVFSTSAFAQDEAGSVSGSPATTPSAPDVTVPNAPVQSNDQSPGPVPAGDEAGTSAAASFVPDTAEIAVAGAVAVGAAICIATCGGSGGNTTTTTTTSPK